MWFSNKKKKLYKAFKRYIPEEKLIDVIEKYGKDLNEVINGTQKFLTVSFTNITGYVTIAEQLELSHLKVYMNRYYQIIFDIIQKYDGIIEKFEADNIMAVYGLYNHGKLVNKACISTLEQITQIEKFFNDWANMKMNFMIAVRTYLSSG